MRNQLKKSISAAFLCIILLLSGACSDLLGSSGQSSEKPPEGMGLVRVVFDYQRSLMPQAPTFSSYELIFTSPGKADVRTTTSVDSVSQALEPGVWTLTVNGYQTVGVKEYKAAAKTVVLSSLSAGATLSVPIILNPIPVGEGGNGIFTYTITASGVSLFGGSLTFVKEAVSSTFPVELDASSHFIEIPPGEYDLFLSLTNDDGKKAGLSTVVYILPGLETLAPGLDFTFTAADFVQVVPLAGKITLTNTSAVAFTSIDDNLDDNLTIYAYKPDKTTLIGAPHISSYQGNDVEWFLTIPANNTAAYLKFELTGSDEHTYTTGIDVPSIPEKGVDDIHPAIVVRKITLPDLTGGSISSRPAAAPGEDVTFTIDPNTGYNFIPGTLALTKAGSGTVEPTFAGGSTYTFTMPPVDISISAQFRDKVDVSGSLTISKPSGVALASGNNITIKAYSGANGTGPFIASASLPWSFQTLPYSLEVPSYITSAYLRVELAGSDGVVYVYDYPTQITGISPTAGKVNDPIYVGMNSIINQPVHGSVDHKDTNDKSRTAAFPGELITLALSPAAGYSTVNANIQVRAVSNSIVNWISAAPPPYTFTMPNDTVTVSAEFLYEYSLTGATYSGGSVTPNQNKGVLGETRVYTVTPNVGYDHVPGTLQLDGFTGTPVYSNSGGVHTYTFIMPAGNVSVSSNPFRSTNANLVSLVLHLPDGDVTITDSAFDPVTFEYTLSSDYDGSTPVVVDYITALPASDLSVLVANNLQETLHTLTITVTAQNSNSKTYTVTISDSAAGSVGG